MSGDLRLTHKRVCYSQYYRKQKNHRYYKKESTDNRAVNAVFYPFAAMNRTVALSLFKQFLRVFDQIIIDVMLILYQSSSPPLKCRSMANNRLISRTIRIPMITAAAESF